MSDKRDDFEFYLNFAKQLILNLSDVKGIIVVRLFLEIKFSSCWVLDRILASAWIQKLLDEDVGSPKLRTDYLKLLLFTLQRKHLVGPFAQNPQDIQFLDEFPGTYKLHDIARALIEEEYAENLAKRATGDNFPPISGECSSNLLEYAACQDIPNFGVHAYYAISNEPINKWTRLSKTIYPKTELDVSERMAVGTLSTTTNATSVARSNNKLTTNENQKKSPPQADLQSSKDELVFKRSLRAPLPVIPVLGDKTEDEEEIRQPPTWGSNLLTVTEPPQREDGEPEFDLEEYRHIEGVDVEQLRKDLETDIDHLDMNEDIEDLNNTMDDSGGEMNFDINFGIMDDNEFDNYMAMLKKQEEDLLAEIEEMNNEEQESPPKTKKCLRPPSKIPNIPSKSQKTPPKKSCFNKDENLKPITQGSPAARDIIDDANATIKKERQKLGLATCEKIDEPIIVDLKHEGMSLRHKVNVAVKDAKKSLESSAAFGNIPITTPSKSPSPERVTNMLGDAEFLLENEILDFDQMQSEFDNVPSLTALQQVQMEVPLDVGVPPTPPRKFKPTGKASTSRIPTPEYVSPKHPKAQITRKGKALVKGKTKVKSTGIRRMDVEAYNEDINSDCVKHVVARSPSESTGTRTIRMNSRKVISDCPSPPKCPEEDGWSSPDTEEFEELERLCAENRCPSQSPECTERFIPPFEFQSPPPYQPPACRKPSFSLSVISASSDALLSMESIEFYESPSPERSFFSPTDAEERKWQRESHENGLFQPCTSISDSILNEEIDFGDFMAPEEKSSFEFMSELRQFPSRERTQRATPLEQQRTANLQKRRNLGSLPRVNRRRRGKTTRRCYGEPPRDDSIKEYFEGPTEAIYASPRRRVPSVYPTVITPPSAERDPCVLPEIHRFEGRSFRQSPAQQHDDLYRTTPKRNAGFKRNRQCMRPRKLAFDENECETQNTISPRSMALNISDSVTRKLGKLGQICPSQSSFMAEEEMKNVLRNAPRPKDLITFKLGEYDYYVSPPKPCAFDEDVPQQGLQKPLIPYEYGWKSPPNLQTCSPNQIRKPTKTTVIKIMPGNAVRIAEEEFPYEEWPFDDNDWQPPSPSHKSPCPGGKSSPSRATPSPAEKSTQNEGFPIDEQLSVVEHLIREYERDIEEQKHSLLPKTPATSPRKSPRSKGKCKKTATTASQEECDATPPGVMARRLTLQRRLFETFNELDNLFDESAIGLYEQEDDSPPCQPSSLDHFREHVKTQAQVSETTNKRRKTRKRNLARSLMVTLPEESEEETEQEENRMHCQTAVASKFAYLNALGLNDDPENCYTTDEYG